MNSVDSRIFKQNIEVTFDGVSCRYDENLFFFIAAKKMTDFISAQNVNNILDLSTGTGVVAIEVATQHRHANIEAIDLSQGMLNRAKKKAEDLGISNIRFKKCDVEDIRYAESTFDVVTCGYALFFYPEMEAAYRAICKTIRPGGKFIFSSFTDEAFNPYAELFLNRLESDYGIEAPSRLRERLKNKGQIEELVSSYKCKDVNIVYFPIRYPISVCDWWSLLNNAGYKSLLNQLSSEQVQKFKEDHLIEIEALSTEGVIELNADTLFGIVLV
jgi:ubiquinone/menaquinone biosynthesis C-methylase UbiE